MPRFGRSGVALVAFVILDGRFRSEAEFEEIVDQAVQVDTDFLVIPTVLFVDYLFTAIWYWGWIRWGQPRWQARKARRSGEHVAHDDRGVWIPGPPHELPAASNGVTTDRGDAVAGRG